MEPAEEIPKQETAVSEQVHSQPEVPKKPIKKYVLWAIVVVAGIGAAIAVGWWLGHGNKQTNQTSTQQPQQTPGAEGTTAAPGVTLDPAKDYGNKYANGVLPVGDNQYTTTAAEKGKIYVCRATFVPASQAGAQTRGPWFIGTTQWDINKKVKVGGSVDWQERLSVSVKDGKRILDTNNLPNHITGIYPVRSTDEAYKYDRNPGTISGQSFVYSLTANPTYGNPNCMGGEVGVMLTGVALFNGFDAGGRDAGAWEVQDACDGHPQNTGIYHYHTLSGCISDVSVSTVIGYALDGFPITGPKAPKGILTTSDLDECHGIVSTYRQDGKDVTGYHYVMTQDFPYSVGCFRAKAADSPGQHTGGGTQQSNGNLQPQPGGPQGGQQPPPGMPQNAPPPPQ